MRLFASLVPLLLVSALLAGCADGGDNFDYDTCGVRPRAMLPVQMNGNIPLVQATVKDQPGLFVLDTGSVGVVLTAAAMQRFDLQSDADRTLSGQGVGGVVSAFAGNLRDFKIGGLAVPDHQVEVLPGTSAISSMGIVDGLFGVSVLSVFEVDLDLPRRQVTLYAGRLCPTTVVPPWTFPYSTIDASQSTAGRFIIPVELDGRYLRALIDTGSGRTVVAKDVAYSLGITDAMLQSDRHITMIGTGPDRPTAYAHRFGQMRVGDDTFPGPVLFVADRPDPSVDMILGSDYLAGHRLWLSYARKRVFVEEGATPSTLTP